MNALVKRAELEIPPVSESRTQLVPMTIGHHLFGIPVLAVHDIVVPDRIYRVPLAPDEIAGSINLRGRIVTVIDMGRRLGQGLLLLSPIFEGGQSPADPHQKQAGDLLIDIRGSLAIRLGNLL